MGLFGKDRAGTVETLAIGRKFIWRIPNFCAIAPNTVLDSALVSSFQGIEFHFHLIVGLRGDIGFYVHHKREKIPKYSFYFRSEGGEATMRQHTAHTIPPDTERCGHWNVCSKDEVRRILPKPDSPLEICFSFDDDLLRKTAVPGEGAMTFEWALPNPTARCLAPFTSASFTFNAVYYVMRLDQQHDGSFVVFVFSRTGLVPPHDIALQDMDGVDIVSLPRTEDMTTQLLRIPRESLERDRVTIRVTMHRGGNPLDVLNSPNANLDGSRAGPAVHPDDERNRKYGVPMEDI